MFEKLSGGKMNKESKWNFYVSFKMAIVIAVYACLVVIVAFPFHEPSIFGSIPPFEAC